MLREVPHAQICRGDLGMGRAHILLRNSGYISRRNVINEGNARCRMLDITHEKTGLDIFVASYQVLSSKQTGREASFTVWTEDVDTLLPETGLVALVSTAELEDGSAGTPKLVAWGDLLAATGDFERVPERYPARYKPVNFPDRAAREALPATEL